MSRLKNGNVLEAAHCLIHGASLVAEHLNMSYGTAPPAYLPIGAIALNVFT